MLAFRMVNFAAYNRRFNSNHPENKMLKNLISIIQKKIITAILSEANGFISQILPENKILVMLVDIA